MSARNGVQSASKTRRAHDTLSHHNKRAPLTKPSVDRLLQERRLRDHHIAAAVVKELNAPRHRLLADANVRDVVRALVVRHAEQAPIP